MEGFQLLTPPMYDVVWSLVLLGALFGVLGFVISSVTGALLVATNRARRAASFAGPVSGSCGAVDAPQGGVARHEA